MDTNDPALRQELERRLRVIETEEVGDPAHDAFPRPDLIALVVVVVLSMIIALIVGL